MVRQAFLRGVQDPRQFTGKVMLFLSLTYWCERSALMWGGRPVIGLLEVPSMKDLL